MKWLSRHQPITRKILQYTTNQYYCRPVQKASSNLLKQPVQVLVSKSNCPFENLAFEEYVYEKILFDKQQRFLFLWRNKPSVVIGRHQNPWLEVNMDLAEMKNISICRRQSGGGTVYHDMGNINLTFFTDRKSYDRKENLGFIIKTLTSAYDLDLRYNDKDDILFDDKYKVSGTAAKLGIKTAYHHCTLLCDTDMALISNLLTRSFGEVETNATQSCPSPTANLFCEKYDFTTLCELFADSYCKSYSQFTSSDLCFIDPLEFKSVVARVEKLKDWSWIYQKTPVFTTSNIVKFSNGDEYEIQLHIRKGIITKSELVQLSVSSSSENTVLKFLLSRLENTRFYYDQFLSILLSENEQNGFRVVQIK